MGAYALDANTTANNNTAFGFCSLRSNTTADNNTAIGSAALQANTTGYQNTAVGRCALYLNTEGFNNTAIGRKALGEMTTGDCNVGVGYNAGDITNTGDNNHSFGYDSNPSSNSVSHQITLGNGANNNLRCADTSISTLSDLRDKTNVEDIPHGLDYILALRPVKFDWNARDGSRVGKKDYGFIAQELDQVEETFGNKEYTRLVHKDNPEKWEADVMKTYPILIKAIQELSEQNKDLKSRIEALESN